MESKIPERFWKSKAGRELCTVMHQNMWDALSEVSEMINALQKAEDGTTSDSIKHELQAARLRMEEARTRIQIAKETLADFTF